MTPLTQSHYRPPLHTHTRPAAPPSIALLEMSPIADAVAAGHSLLPQPLLTPSLCRLPCTHSHKACCPAFNRFVGDVSLRLHPCIADAVTSGHSDGLDAAPLLLKSRGEDAKAAALYRRGEVVEGQAVPQVWLVAAVPAQGARGATRV